MNTEYFEEKIARYESKFATGEVPNLREYVKNLNCDCHELLAELLAELLHIDLELRIRHGYDTRVEHYFKQFPQVIDDGQLVDELIQTEFKVRQQYEPGLAINEYVTRFADRGHLKLGRFGPLKDLVHADQQTILPTKTNSYSDVAQRFRKCYLHRQGGLGNVWLAIDRELGQHVALKEIRPRFINSASHRARFVREALVTSKLDHPGIVSVYGMGQRIDGAPYFAMQFIRGRTFRTAIADYHSKEQLPSGAISPRFRRLIQHFLDVCNTVEYAHSQNVVHRDLKPDNIMIGEFGETFVVDWGLAKASLDAEIDQEQSSETYSDPADSFRAILSEARSRSSIDGTRIGSPGFMSPEQYAGERDSIGPTSDIYSLGATLYSLITSQERPAADANNNGIAGVRKNIIQAYGPLKSICEKAMAPKPRDRYQSASKLAEDVENFLLDRPIHSHRESFMEQFERVGRRYRASLNTALVAMVLLLILSLMSVAWINRERNNAVSARNSEIKQRQKAENRTDQLTDTIGVFADMFSGTDRRGVGIDLNNTTLQKALDELNSQIENYDDPIVKAFLHTVLARNSRSSGNPGRAKDQYSLAIQILKSDGIEDSDPLFLKSLIGLCGSMADSGGERKKSIEIADQVIGICETDPDNYQHTLFETLLIKARLLLDNNQSINVPELIAVVAQVNEIGERIFADDPGNIQLLRAKLLAAEVLHFQGRSDELIPTYSKLVDDWKSRYPLHSVIVRSQVKLAEHEVFYKQFRPALDRLRMAAEDAITLFGEDHPAALSIQSRYGMMLVFGHGTDEGETQRGLSLLETCRQQQIDKNNLYSATSMTLALVRGLLKVGGAENAHLAIRCGEELFEHVKDIEESSFADEICSLNMALSSAYEKIGNMPASLAAIEKSIAYAKRRFGEESNRTVAMLRERQRLRVGGRKIESDKSKEYTRIVAKLMLSHPPASVKELTKVHQEFVAALNSNPAGERPTAMAMYYLTEKLVQAHEKTGNISQALEAVEECLSYSRMVFGDDSPPHKALIRQQDELSSLVESSSKD